MFIVQHTKSLQDVRLLNIRASRLEVKSCRQKIDSQYQVQIYRYIFVLVTYCSAAKMFFLAPRMNSEHNKMKEMNYCYTRIHSHIHTHTLNRIVRHAENGFDGI